MSAAAVAALKTVLVGCGGMGGHQARLLSELEGYTLSAVCDAYEPNLKAVSEARGVKAYSDFGEMLAAERPEVAAICTQNALHAPMTIQAAKAGVRGVFCEKPMATHMADAREMVRVCRERGVKLVVNHQRRIGADLLAARRIVESGDLGEIKLVRGQCAGDLLSDGTHVIDSVLFLFGDPGIAWVSGMLHREPGVDLLAKGRRRVFEDLPADPEQARKRKEAQAGRRYGHAVETGGFAILQLENGVRFELACGDLRDASRAYQDYELIGARGRLWRTGDRAAPNLFIGDARGGAWEAGLEDFCYKPVPVKDGGAGPWRPVELNPDEKGGIEGGYRTFYRTILEDAPHPMAGDVALRGFEALMAVYESARLARPVVLPLRQDRFPLDAMIEEGRA
ncbi:MAG: Gfo/Idh/MocA family oxidoreductase [Planctomycetota bacterium]|nr:Gfo/Idh/MocA family oxidoreductase [Planctomycetota bacterium]